MKKIVLPIFAFLLVGAPLWAVPLASLVNREADEYPLREDINWEAQDEPDLTLLPDLPGSAEIKSRFMAYEPELTVQRLYRFEIPEGFSGNTAEERLKLFTAVVNIFGRPETQVGYVYRSHTREEETPLFEDNFLSNKRGRRVDNFWFTPETLPEEFEYYQVVDEANFSKTVFSQRIAVDSESLWFTSINEERIWLKFIPLLGAGKTRNELFMFVHDSFLYTFNCTQLKKVPAAKKLGVPVNITSMFRKRMDVLAYWMEDQLTQSGIEQ